MTYILESRLCYRAEDGCIWECDDGEKKLTLPPTSNRLLHLLIEQQGNVVLREDIYYQVWESFFLEPSGTSLNNHISQLRKIIFNHGIEDEIITTIPRIGFTIKNHVKIEEVRNATQPQKPALPLIPALSSHTPVMSWSPARFVIIILFFTASLLIIKGLADRILPNRFVFSMPVTAQRIEGKCEAWYLEDTAQKKSTIPAQVVVMLASKYHLNCDKNSVLFIHINNNAIFNQSGTVFASRCARSGQSGIENCHNVLLNKAGY